MRASLGFVHVLIVLYFAPAARSFTALQRTTFSFLALDLKKTSLFAAISPKYVRWQKLTESTWAMQTAVTTFEIPSSLSSSSQEWTACNRTNANSRVELHAQLHFGDAEYFDYYNSDSFNKHRIVLYELLLDEGLLEQETTHLGLVRRIRMPLSASQNDQQTAKQYGWNCQVEIIGYSRENWIHADLTRQEFLSLAEQEESEQQQTPLWKVAQSKVRNNRVSSFVIPPAAADAATALIVGPPILKSSTTQISRLAQRRLFSNLFLPGSALAQLLRVMLWFTVPSPELSVLLLDWSSLLLTKTGPTLSQIALPLLQALSNGRLDQLRRLVFGQVIITGNQLEATVSQGGRDDEDRNSAEYDLLIRQRNRRALKTLQQIQQARLVEQAKSFIFGDIRYNNNLTMAMLYGCSHCFDLHQQLVYNLGYRPIKTEWRTAWTTSPTCELTSSSSSEYSTTLNGPNSETAAARITAIGLLVLLPCYFAVGGLDWIATLGSIVAINGNNLSAWAEVTGETLLYLIRHVVLYMALSKVLLDWDQDP